MEKLNKDEVFLIGIKLDVKSLGRLSCVNKKLYSLCRNDILWKYLLKRDFSFPYEYEENENFKTAKDYYRFFSNSKDNDLFEALRLKSELIIDWAISSFPFERGDDDTGGAFKYGFRCSCFVETDEEDEEDVKLRILQCCVEENGSFRKLTPLEKKVAISIKMYGETKEEEPIISENIGKIVDYKRIDRDKNKI